MKLKKVFENGKYRLETDRYYICEMINYGMANKPKEYYNFEKSNAEHIVKCVNSYETLLVTLRNCIVDAELTMSKKERLQRIEYARQAIKEAEH